MKDTATPCHGDETRPVGRPRDIPHLDVASEQKRANARVRTGKRHCTVYTIACVAILVMQSEPSLLPVATKVPSGEIAHEYTCDHNQQFSITISMGRAARQKQRKTTYIMRVRRSSRLLDQVMHHYDQHFSRFFFLQLQLLPTRARQTQRDLSL